MPYLWLSCAIIIIFLDFLNRYTMQISWPIGAWLIYPPITIIFAARLPSCWKPCTLRIRRIWLSTGGLRCGTSKNAISTTSTWPRRRKRKAWENRWREVATIRAVFVSWVKLGVVSIATTIQSNVDWFFFSQLHADCRLWQMTDEYGNFFLLVKKKVNFLSKFWFFEVKIWFLAFQMKILQFLR